MKVWILFIVIQYGQVATTDKIYFETGEQCEKARAMLFTDTSWRRAVCFEGLMPYVRP